MKKFVSLLVVLVMAMSLATAAFALKGAGNGMDPYIVNSADDLVGYELTLEPGASATFKFANQYAGATLVVSGGPVSLYSSMNQGIPAGEAVQVVISGNFMWGYTVDVVNESESAQTYTMEIVVPLGSTGNPEELTIGTNAAAPSASAGFDYYYTYTSTEAGTLTLSDIVLDTDMVDSYNIQISSDGFYNYSELLDENWMPKDSVSFDMAAGETVMILVRAMDWDGAESTEVSFNAEFVVKTGTQDNPIFIQMATDLSGVDVAAGSETYLAISSMLNDKVLTIVGDENTTVTVNGTAVTPVDGVFSVVLNGVPTNRVVVANNGSEDASYLAFVEDVPGSENNPYVIETEAQLTDLEAVGYSSYYYAISSRLNGQVLNIKGDANTSVIYNGEEVEGVDGVFTIELNGAPTNRLMVLNNADETATIEFEFVENIPETGDFSIAGVVVCLMAATAGAVVIGKKKEF